MSPTNSKDLAPSPSVDTRRVPENGTDQIDKPDTDAMEDARTFGYHCGNTWYPCSTKRPFLKSEPAFPPSVPSAREALHASHEVQIR